MLACGRHFVNKETNMKRPIIITLLGAALLLVCIGIGAVLFFGFFRGPASVPFLNQNNRVSASVEESETLKVDEDKTVTLKVIDDAGSVTIVGGEVDSVEVRVVKTAYAATQASAEEKVKTIQYDIEQAGNAITLKYQLPNLTAINNFNFNTVDFVVTVPLETTIDIDSNLGDVRVTRVTGNTVIVNDFGQVTLEEIEGALSVSNNSGEITAASIEAGNGDIDLQSDFGSITLQNASGQKITLDSNSGTITLQEVRATGDISTNTDFGNTSFENGSGDSLTVETNSGKVTLVKIRVRNEINVKDDFGEIELEQALASSYDLHTNSGSITVDGTKGKLKASTDFGGINVKNAEAVTLDLQTQSGTVEFAGSLGDGPHIVQSDFGEINLTLPADSKLDVDLSTDFGSIKSDLPITVTLDGTSGSDSEKIVGSINGGGDQFTAQTNSGSVTIHAGQ